MSRVVMIAVSKDGGYTWGDWVPYDLQREGKYDDPQPTRRRLGVGKQWLVKFRITDPVVAHLVAAEYE